MERKEGREKGGGVRPRRGEVYDLLKGGAIQRGGGKKVKFPKRKRRSSEKADQKKIGVKKKIILH